MAITPSKLLPNFKGKALVVGVNDEYDRVEEHTMRTSLTAARMLVSNRMVYSGKSGYMTDLTYALYKWDEEEATWVIVSLIPKGTEYDDLPWKMTPSRRKEANNG